VQSWDQYVGDIVSSDITFNSLHENYGSFAIDSESLRETQEHIEQWTMDNAPLSKSAQISPVEEKYICYGTVSYLILLEYEHTQNVLGGVQLGLVRSVHNLNSTGRIALRSE
jgi:hypothetical protein